MTPLSTNKLYGRTYIQSDNKNNPSKKTFSHNGDERLQNQGSSNYEIHSNKNSLIERTNAHGYNNHSLKEQTLEHALQYAEEFFISNNPQKTGKDWINECLCIREKNKLEVKENSGLSAIYELTRNTSKYFGTEIYPRGFQKLFAIGYMYEAGAKAFKIDGKFNFTGLKDWLEKDIMNGKQLTKHLDKNYFVNIRQQNGGGIIFGKTEYKNIWSPSFTPSITQPRLSDAEYNVINTNTNNGIPIVTVRYSAADNLAITVTPGYGYNSEYISKIMDDSLLLENGYTKSSSSDSRDFTYTFNNLDGVANEFMHVESRINSLFSLFSLINKKMDVGHESIQKLGLNSTLSLSSNNKQIVGLNFDNNINKQKINKNNDSDQAQIKQDFEKYKNLISKKLDVNCDLKEIKIIKSEKITNKWFIEYSENKRVCFEYNNKELLVYLQTINAKCEEGESSKVRKAVLVNLENDNVNDVVIRNESGNVEYINTLNKIIKSNPPNKKIELGLCVPQLWREKTKSYITIAKYAPGNNLYNINKIKTYTIEDAQNIYKKVIDMCNYFGENNILLCDLHADNIKLDDDNNIFLFDFDNIHNYFEVKENRIEDIKKNGKTLGYLVHFDYRGLNKLKTELILRIINPEDKIIFSAFCETKNKTLIAT